MMKLSGRFGATVIVLSLCAIIGWLGLVSVTLTSRENVVGLAPGAPEPSVEERALTKLPAWCTNPGGVQIGALLSDPSCDYHVYSPEQMQDVFANQHIVFIGVSYTRNMYRCFCDLLTNGGSAHVDARWPEDRRNGPFPGSLAVACNNQNANAHFDNRIEIAERNISVEFYWSSLKKAESDKCTQEQCMVSLYKAEGNFPPETVADAAECVPGNASCLTPYLTRYCGFRQRDVFIPALMEWKRQHNYPVTMFVADARGDGSHPELEMINLPRFIYAFSTKNPTTNWRSPYLQEFSYGSLKLAYKQDLHLHGDAALAFINVLTTLMDRLLQHLRDPTQPFTTPAPTVSSLIARNRTLCLDIYPDANNTYCSTERFHAKATGMAYDSGALNHFKYHRMSGFP